MVGGDFNVLRRARGFDFEAFVDFNSFITEASILHIVILEVTLPSAVIDRDLLDSGLSLIDACLIKLDLISFLFAHWSLSQSLL